MRIAFVVPRYGTQVIGGAETLARKFAENLKKREIDVEVLTTCAFNHFTWDNHFKEGRYFINNVPVNRFCVNNRNKELFHNIQNRIINNMKVSIEDQLLWAKESVNSDSLYDYIYKNIDSFDHMIFLPYMFGTTFFGAMIYPERSILLPCLHEEVYSHLPIYRILFDKGKGVIFNTEEEMKLGKYLFYLEDNKCSVIGMGFDYEIVTNPMDFRRKFNIHDDFILYVGRREEGKNVPLLLKYFLRYKEKKKSNLKLVLLGGGEIGMKDNNIILIDSADEMDKLNAYSASSIVCQPSINESFSIIMMEAWICKTPVIVHYGCEVTSGHCIRSNGGLYFNDYYEFEAIVDLLINDKEIADKMGNNGYSYVIDNYNWDIILKKFFDALNGF